MSKKRCFGIDVGGTSVKIGLFSESELLEKWEIPTRKENNGEYILDDITHSIKSKIIEKNIDNNDIIGLGIGVPGPVTEDGTVNVCVNIGWGKFNIVQALSEKTGFKVKASNDANVAALGEMWKGGGEGYKNITLVTLGTGVGGGVTIDGKILNGNTGSAGEIGHMYVLYDEEEVCNCGNKGCLEQIASATGIVRFAKRFMKKYSTPSDLRNIENLTAKNVLDLAKNNDELALMVMEEVCKYLGIALANVNNVVDPDAFVIGGGVSKAGEFLLNMIEKHYKKYAFHTSRNKKFLIATLGNDAGIYGSAKLMLN